MTATAHRQIVWDMQCKMCEDSWFQCIAESDASVESASTRNICAVCTVARRSAGAKRESFQPIKAYRITGE